MATVMILLGYVFELVGSFILAATAIGLERIEALTHRLEWLRGRLEDKRPEDSKFEWNDPARWTAGIGAALGSGLSVVLVESHFRNEPRLWQYLIHLGTAVLAGTMVLAFIFLVRLSAIGLRSIDERTRAGSVGGLGFAFLFFGFVLQFLGTLLSAIRI